MPKLFTRQVRRFAKWVLLRTDTPLDHFEAGYKAAAYAIMCANVGVAETHSVRARGAREAIRKVQALRDGTYSAGSFGAYLKDQLEKQHG